MTPRTFDYVQRMPSLSSSARRCSLNVPAGAAAGVVQECTELDFLAVDDRGSADERAL